MQVPARLSNPIISANIKYEGLQSLIRFEWGSGKSEEPPRKKSPRTNPAPTPPDSQSETVSTTTVPRTPSIPPTPNPFDQTVDPADCEFNPVEPDVDNDEAIEQITAIARNEAFHLVHSWPLGNGTGFQTPDLPYVHFFMTQLPNVLWFAGITGPVTQHIMAKARDQPVLHHAVLCTAAALLAERSRAEPSRYLEHKQKTLALLREHIDNLEIDEGVAAAVFFMLFMDIGQQGARSHLRGLKSVLDFLKRKTLMNDRGELSNSDKTIQSLPKSDFQNPDITGVSPLAWLIWAWGIRMDIALATVDGSPMIAPLPTGPEHQAFHRSWISALSDPSIPNSADWGLANFTLDNIMHRGCHVARKARLIRASPNYTVEGEEMIHQLCREIDRELELWHAQPLIQQAQLEEDLYQFTVDHVPPDRCFLHYAPLLVRDRMKSNLLMDYRTAKIYSSLVQYPTLGPGPPGSGRFQHAVEICRVLAATPVHERDDVRGAEEAMCLFLAGMTFGGDAYYPLETRWVQRRFEEYFPTFTAIGKDDLLGIWLENCPCVPMVKEKNFPWTIMESLGIKPSGNIDFSSIEQS